MIVQTLQSLLKPTLPEVHATRFRAVMAAVKSGLSGAKVAITALGRAVSGTAHIKHKIKRMDRLIGNPHLNGERVAFYKDDPVAIARTADAVDPDRLVTLDR